MKYREINQNAVFIHVSISIRASVPACLSWQNIHCFTEPTKCVPSKLFGSATLKLETYGPVHKNILHKYYVVSILSLRLGN